MARHSSLELYDTILGDLKQRLRDWRDEDPPISFNEIAARLREDKVVVTSETVRRWFRRMNEEEAA